jgi:2-oxoglutarate dehydrogenase E1 component
VVIDIFCYRRFGHNEGDEPMFTNPAMYNRIKKQKTTLTLYTERLIRDGLIPEGEVEEMKAQFQARLNEEFEAGKAFRPNKADWLDGRWSHIDRQSDKDYERGDTAVSPETLAEVGPRAHRVPPGFAVHKTVERQLEAKREMFASGEGFDWATAEALAFGSLLTEGFPVRLSGQDSTRGTFSQRHSAFINQETEERHYPLNAIRRARRIRGHRLDALGIRRAGLRIRLHALRAQRARAVGGAVRRLRQRRADHVRPVHLVGRIEVAADERTGHAPAPRLRGPGPRALLARLERFLQMCGQENWIVANCTTPANYFHILRGRSTGASASPWC